MSTATLVLASIGILFVIANLLLRSNIASSTLLTLLALMLVYQSISNEHHLQACAEQQVCAEPIRSASPAPLPTPSTVVPDVTAANMDDNPVLDELKTRYEELFVNYYYLKRCAAPDPHLYDQIRAALLEDLAAANASAALLNNIETAALGLHDEMYVTSACNNEHVLVLKQAVEGYLQQQLSQHPSQR